MKQLFTTALMIVLSVSLQAQKGEDHVIAELNLLEGSLGCQLSKPLADNQMRIDFTIDTMPGGGCWVEWYHLGGWFILENSVRFTNPSLHPTFGDGTAAWYTFQV